MPATGESDLYAITIDFKKDSTDPARVFRAMTDLIEAFKALDLELVHSIDIHVEPVALLEDVEAGSLRAWLKTILQATDDTGLKEGDWKKVVGVFLYKAKYRIISWTEGKTSIVNRADVKQLENELLALSEETNVKRIPTYAPIPPAQLLNGVHRITYSLAQLSKEDRASLTTPDGTIPFNMAFSVTPNQIRDLLVRETITNENVLILKVKKPDYLGESMWEFKHDGHSRLVKILDTRWLAKFQSREIDVRPQDSLRARVRVTAHYSSDGDVIDTDYVVLEVLEVIPSDPPSQQLFP